MEEDKIAKDKELETYYKMKKMEEDSQLNNVLISNLKNAAGYTEKSSAPKKKTKKTANIDDYNYTDEQQKEIETMCKNGVSEEDILDRMEKMAIDSVKPGRGVGQSRTQNSKNRNKYASDDDKETDKETDKESDSEPVRTKKTNPVQQKRQQHLQSDSELDSRLSHANTSSSSSKTREESKRSSNVHDSGDDEDEEDDEEDDGYDSYKF